MQAAVGTRRRLVGIICVLLSFAATGAPVTAATAPECVHPHPCGGEWPQGLEGPFALKSVERISIPMSDGVVLNGWLGMPELPAGVKAPVALHSTPYLGDCWWWGCDATAAEQSWVPGEPGWWDDQPHSWALRAWGVRPIDLIREGYAAAFVSVRGSGGSGGCLDYFGSREQLDQKELVDWFGAQPWSNGRVAMGGASYPGTTPLEAAIHSNDEDSPLKMIMASVPVTDAYTTWHTPQGANYTTNSWGWPLFTAGNMLPPVGSGPEILAEAAPGYPDRLCPDAIKVLTEGTTELAIEERDEAFWRERALIDRFPEITAAVLFMDGFQNLGQATQNSAAWDTLVRAPKRQIDGQWKHASPFKPGMLNPARTLNQWPELIFGWLDYWLKGKGDVARLELGTTDYLDDEGTWHGSTSWPPAEASDEVLYFRGTTLHARKGAGARTFRAVPDARNNYWTTTALPSDVGVEPVYTPWAALCPSDPAAAGSEGLMYVSEPIAEGATIAGNPFAYLRLSSSEPGGIVAVALAAVREDMACVAGQPQDAKLLALGAADLRFHDGNLTGEDFPVGKPVHVRVDLWDLASVVPAGHRLAVVVNASAGPGAEWIDPRYAPQITVHGGGGARGSQVVVPFVHGTAGGSAPRLDYSPRPFVPAT